MDRYGFLFLRFFVGLRFLYGRHALVLGRCVLVFCCSCVGVVGRVCVLSCVCCVLCMLVDRCPLVVRRWGGFVLVRGFCVSLRVPVVRSGFLSLRLRFACLSMCSEPGPGGEVVVE